MSGWVKIGECLVDSGQIMLIDPCYVLPDRPEEQGYDYRLLLKGWEDNKNKYFSTEGGVVVESGYGDGTYPVYVKMEGRRVSAVMIDFLGEE